MINQSEFDKWLETAQHTEYIIRIRYKYSHETFWTYSNEYFYYDNSEDLWIWENDWNEGQSDVEYIGWVKLEEAHNFTQWMMFKSRKGGDDNN